MADITMCRGHECPRKEKCYRHTAPIGYFQSWFVYSPFNEYDPEECDKFIPVDAKDERV